MKADLATIGPEATLKARWCVGPTRAKGSLGWSAVERQNGRFVSEHTSYLARQSFQFGRLSIALNDEMSPLGWLSELPAGFGQTSFTCWKLSLFSGPCDSGWASAVRPVLLGQAPPLPIATRKP